MMQLTDIAVDKLNNSSEPIVMTRYVLGNAHNYVPNRYMTGIKGVTTWQGEPSSPLPTSANIIKYGIYLDFDIGDFDVGEIALYTADGELFAIGVLSELVRKQKIQPNESGNSLRIDVYLSMVGQNYSMWVDYSEMNNQMDVPNVTSVDQLPAPKDAQPNVMIVQGESSERPALLAYTDRNNLWSITGYTFLRDATNEYTVLSSTPQTIVVEVSGLDKLTPEFLGQKVIQFSTGGLYGICRVVKAVVELNNTYVLELVTRLAIQPEVGDKLQVLTMQDAFGKYQQLPVATKTRLGAVIVGEGINVSASGVISVPPPNEDLVYNVQNLTTVDSLERADIASPNMYIVQGATSQQSGFLAYAQGNGMWAFDAYKYTTTSVGPFSVLQVNGNDILVNVPNAEEYMISYLGRIIVQGYSGEFKGYCRYVSNTSVIGNNLLVTLNTPLDNHNQIRVGDELSFYIRDQRSTTYNDLPIATVRRLGVVRVGDGLNIDESGVLSVDFGTGAGEVLSVNGYTGIVKLEASDIPGTVTSVNGNAPDGTGNVTITTPVETASTTQLGVVQLPSGPGAYISINAGGIINLNFTPVTSIEGQTGDVYLDGLLTQGAVTTPNDAIDVGVYWLESVGPGTVSRPTEAESDIATVLVTPIGTSRIVQTWLEPSGKVFTRTATSAGTGFTDWQAPELEVPIATNVDVGGVIVGETLSIDIDGTLDVGVATSTSLGGVIAGPTLTVDPAGELNTRTATKTRLGTIQVGDYLTIDATGILSVDVATESSPGVISVAAPFSITNGVLGIQDASFTQKGVVRVGSGLNVEDGVITTLLRSVNNQLPDSSGNIAVDTSLPMYEAESTDDIGQVGFYEYVPATNADETIDAADIPDVINISIYSPLALTLVDIQVPAGKLPNTIPNGVINVYRLPSSQTLVATGDLESV